MLDRHHEFPDEDLPLNGQFLVRVIVEGSPPLRLEATIGSDPVLGLDGVSTGQLAAAMTAMRAIPDVLGTPSGVVAPHCTGACSPPSEDRECRSPV